MNPYSPPFNLNPQGPGLQAMAEPKLDPNIPPGLHLVSAFFCMDPIDSLISLSRKCGGGLVTESVQRFIWDYCISNKADEQGYEPYLKNFIKKLIFEVESKKGTVLDKLYEQCGYYMSTLKDDGSGKGSVRVCKCISFHFPDGCELSSCPKSRKLVVPLHCSLNMLEGDTGCSVWPSSLYLSEFVLSFPDIFSNKSCFEVGSGVGLVGICLSHAKASKVILSDGDLSTLANMKLNLELNQLRTDTDVPERSSKDWNMAIVEVEMDCKSEVKCVHQPWESAVESELQDFMPDIVLGADIIYDPSCLPHLVRVLGILLNQTKAHSLARRENLLGSLQDTEQDVKTNGTSEEEALHAHNLDGSVFNSNQDRIRTEPCQVEELHVGSSAFRLQKSPMAYIATVIRNIDTFNYFLELSEKAHLTVTDVTETLKPLNLLPYMQSYDRSSIHLFTVECRYQHSCYSK